MPFSFVHSDVLTTFISCVSQSKSFHSSPRSSPRLRPVNAASVKKIVYSADVSEIAKNLNVTSKEVSEVLKTYLNVNKKSGAVLTSEELNIIFEYFTHKTMLPDLNEYYASANEPAEEKPAPAAKAKKEEKTKESEEVTFAGTEAATTGQSRMMQAVAESYNIINNGNGAVVGAAVAALDTAMNVINQVGTGGHF